MIRGDEQMKKRILILLMFMTLPLMVGGSAPALADYQRTVVGLAVFHAPWEGGMDIFIDLDVREVSSDTHRATGPVSWRIWHEEWGWREVDAYASCVQIDEEAGEAILVSRIVRKTGWGQGEPGEYAYWWVHDSGEGDQFAINYYSMDPFYEFFPRGRPPDCECFDQVEPPIDFELGDLAID